MNFRLPQFLRQHVAPSKIIFHERKAAEDGKRFVEVWIEVIPTIHGERWIDFFHYQFHERGTPDKQERFYRERDRAIGDAKRWIEQGAKALEKTSSSEIKEGTTN